MVSRDPVLKKRVLVFDHHKSAINDGCDKYDFTTIMETSEDGVRRCGTDLFYQHLCSGQVLSSTPALDEFVELTRLEDTWDWKSAKEKGLKAHDMAILFNAVGIEKYIEHMLVKVLSGGMQFTEEEKSIISGKKKEYLETLKEIWSGREYFVDEYDNRFAGVFADYECRGELCEYVRSLNENNLKYLIIVAFIRL